LRHGFRIGSSIALERVPSEDIDWYKETFKKTFSAGTLEYAIKWSLLEPKAGKPDYSDALLNLDFADEINVPLKGHVLVWGMVIPNKSGMGVPSWLIRRYPIPFLSSSQRSELRGLLHNHINDVASAPADRIELWDVTNETIHPTAWWFINRLGFGIVGDVYRWASSALGPNATLLLNEAIGEPYMLPWPTVRGLARRVKNLQASGVSPDAIGLQAPFAPFLANIGLYLKTSRRVPIDKHAATINRIAEIGLPIYISEFAVACPTDDAEKRAAQMEGLMRLYFGYPAVREIIFWGFYTGRHWAPERYDAGIWSLDHTPTRHGEAALSLLNDRWRTNMRVRTDDGGRARIRAFYGEYVVNWEIDGQAYHACFAFSGNNSLSSIRLF